MEDLLKKTIKLYLGEHILNRVLERGESALKVNSELKEVTMMSTDILPFTSIDRKYSTKELNELLNDYLSSMFYVIKKYDGKINSVDGNAILSFWDIKEHAKKACECSLKSLKISKEISAKWEKIDFPKIITTIGVNTGEISIGNYGSKEKLIFSIFGDQVNFTKRSQGANKSFNMQILVSEGTKSLVNKDFEFTFVQEIKIKGKTDPVNLYTIK